MSLYTHRTTTGSNNIKRTVSVVWINWGVYPCHYSQPVPLWKRLKLSEPWWTWGGSPGGLYFISAFPTLCISVYTAHAVSISLNKHFGQRWDLRLGGYPLLVCHFIYIFLIIVVVWKKNVGCFCLASLSPCSSEDWQQNRFREELWQCESNGSCRCKQF